MVIFTKLEGLLLDYFKVPEKDVVIVKPEILKETTKLMFMKCGVSEDEAEGAKELEMLKLVYGG